MPKVVVIKGENLRAVRLAANRFRARAKNLRPAWRYVRPYLYTVFRRQFESEGAYNGTPWAKLSAGYLKWKTQNYPGRQILELFGNLKRAAGGEGRGAIKELGDTDLMIGIRHPAAVYHQQGTARMPAREIYTPLGDEDSGFIAELLIEHLLPEDDSTF